MENPLLIYKNDANDSFIRFDLIKDEHFEPAFELALATAKSNLQKLIDNPEAPTFENTIEALEYISEDLDRIASILFNLKEAHSNEVITTLAEKISPVIADFTNDVSLNQLLFNRVKFVYDSHPQLETKEQYRLLEKTYKGFVRSGALLSETDKKTLREYDKQLAILSQQFGSNLLGATNEYELNLIEEKDISGIPKLVREMAAKEAKDRGKEGWVFTLKAPSVGPFLKSADNAELRKQIVLASSSRGMNAPFDNKNIVFKIVQLRKKRAELLGYPSHSHFVLDDRMAKDPKNVEHFFSTLHEVSRPLAEKDFEMLRSYKEKITGEKELYPWDVAYYEDKIKKEQFFF